MGTILIVDDLPADRDFLATLLRDQGHRVLGASNGREGLTAVRSEPVDLVITDVLMPVMDGDEFVTQLRLDPAAGRLPVLFYTPPYGEREARALALANGPSWVLTKPAQPDEVRRIVSRVLAGECEEGLPSPFSGLTTDAYSAHLRLRMDAEHPGDLRSANVRLRAVINIGLELAPERDTTRLLHRVCVAARDLFGATYVTLGLVDPDERTILRAVTCGTDARCGVGLASWFEIDGAVPGVLGEVVAERRAVRARNPGGDPLSLQLPPLHPEVQAFLAVPLVSAAHVYGWICLVSNDGPMFTEDDEHLVTALSAQVGRIYENLSCSAAAIERAGELEHEILDRKRAETSARHQQTRAERYLDAAEVILLKLDTQGRIALINRYACEVLGWTAEELTGRDWAETCLPARARDSLRKWFANILAGDLSVVESPVLTRSGEERLVEWRSRLLRDEAGTVLGTFSSGTDITARDQAVEALRVAEERMRFALEAAGVGIWDMNYATGTLDWSKTLQAQHGIEPGAFHGTYDEFAAHVYPADRAQLFATIDGATRSGADFSVEYRTLWPDGTVRWLSGAGRIVLGAKGEPVRGVGIARDVTERRTLEAQYQQAQKMEAVGRLAGGVAHDFNNLLTVILGSCEMLLTDLDPVDPRREDIAVIQKSGLRAARLTRQLLAFSRKEIIQPVLLDLNVVMRDMRSMLGRLIEEDVSLVLGIQPDPALVIADLGQIEQIVMNLAVNARDAMPSGGTLTIDVAVADPHVVLTVTDTGTGMTPEVMGRLFEPFFTTKEVGKGTGLGLATIHGIVASSGGRVDVRSEVGTGSAFIVSFPRAAASANAADPPSIPQRRSGTQTVLIVEDEDELREVARKLLERQGYTVLAAANADDAIRLFAQGGPIDVLLTDVVMPGTSGPELARRLIDRRPALKVIYMTGYTDDATVHRGVLNPGVTLLHKPFTTDTLGRKVREAFDR